MADPGDQRDFFIRSRRSWPKKLADAIRGLQQGAAGQSSFLVHVLAAIVVVVLAVALKMPLERWCLLVICIGIVIAAELFNSSLESICRSITDRVDPHIERGLNIAAAAVLVSAVTAAIAGGIIFVNAILEWAN